MSKFRDSRLGHYLVLVIGLHFALSLVSCVIPASRD